MTTLVRTDRADQAAATLSAGELAEVVQAFGSASERLASSHESLELETRRLREELAEARGQLARARELAALGELAAGIAHEIRNPLGAIVLGIEDLRAGLAGDRHPRVAACDALRRAAGRIESIVADVLRFAREGRLERRPVAVRPIVDEALADLAATLDRSGAAVRIVDRDRREPTPLAELDRGLCVQAVANLVRNAVEAMESLPAAGRVVRIELGRVRRCDAGGRRGEQVTIAVEDRGPGVPDAEFVRIFRPFASGRGGTGLGLAIVHRIVDAHGGRITVRNVSPGARFEMSLPVRADPGSDPAPEAGDPLSLATWRRLGRDGPPRRAG
jgi:signal transduction histidine kinase